eukprot:CAMPEP_0170294016 /NCGR_PEP_ID=MMETSP0116_2-20130129/47117_1 /TAXON_ID=400756 /ORGANISM="Durinskia baltica, Strain CSIRO CS-38" /LENGTH=778 /DNA_ID=CAMNT_0010545537 /DNA_START=75 /DNA_END=2411 /DNA_ORIENTATION=+
MLRLVSAVAICALPGAFATTERQGTVAKQHALEAAWDRELEPGTTQRAYVSPVKRVVNLLQKIKGELEAEADKEAEMYDKMVCWCETTEKEKAKAVADAEAKIEALEAEIEARSARFGKLSAEIARTKEEIAENTAALKQARTLREEAAGKFRGDEKDLVQAIDNLRNAIAVLAKHQKTQALLQLNGPVLTGMRVLLRDAALRYEVLVAARAESQGAAPAALLAIGSKTAQRSGDAGAASAALLQALDTHGASVPQDLPLKFAARLVAQEASGRAFPSKSFLQVRDRQPLYESRSSARSAGIYGVLTQMLEEFEAELSTEQKEELVAQASFKELSAAKEAEIEAGKKKLDEMQAEDAGNAKALSDAKEDLGLTRDQRSADVKFLQNLKLQCNDLDAQWEKRSQTRAAETKAVAEAIAILMEDDNREVLHRSVTLLQESASAGVAAKRRSAAEVLRRAAQAPEFDTDDLLAAWRGRSGRASKLGAAAGPRAQLSTLAMSVQLDSFAKVKEMIDKMHADLKEQQAEEVKFKAWCESELDETEKTTYHKTEEKRDLEAKMDRLATLIKKLQAEIDEAKKQIAQTQHEIKQASQDRESENAEFQTLVADQRATQSILNKALTKLKDFYHKKIGNKVVFAQVVQTPPVQFNVYRANEGSSPVIGLIEQIMEDSKALESAATSGEAKAQADYEKFVKDGNTLIKDLNAQITSKTKAIAAADADKAQAVADHESTMGELESLAAYDADLHNQCDFVLKNFDIRQKARMQEMEAIKSAKAILSGEQ